MCTRCNQLGVLPPCDCLVINTRIELGEQVSQSASHSQPAASWMVVANKAPLLLRPSRRFGSASRTRNTPPTNRPRARPVEPWIAQSAECIHYYDVKCRSLRANTRFADKADRLGTDPRVILPWPWAGISRHTVALHSLAALPSVPPGDLAVRTVSGPYEVQERAAGGSGWAVVAGGLTHLGLTLTLNDRAASLTPSGGRAGAPIGPGTAEPRGRCGRRYFACRRERRSRWYS